MSFNNSGLKRRLDSMLEGDQNENLSVNNNDAHQSSSTSANISKKFNLSASDMENRSTVIAKFGRYKIFDF
jgi:hypothetical protein